MLHFGRAMCGDYAAASQREWLVTNGLGSYAAGTVAGSLTRCYHGLLVAALDPPLGRTLLLTKLDPTVAYAGQTFALACDRWSDGRIAPQGHQLIERFWLDGTTPVWHYALADVLLEIRIWMRPGHDTTYLRYTVLRASSPLELRLAALANQRDHHGNTRAGPFTYRSEPTSGGLCVTAGSGLAPLYLTSDQAQATPALAWRTGYWLAIEHERGLLDQEDHVLVGRFTATLEPGASLLFAASITPDVPLDAPAAWNERVRYDTTIRQRVTWSDDPLVQQLALAADQVIVQRGLAPHPTQATTTIPGKTILAGYPWFSDWGRDTMIALPGLTLPTGRPADAALIIRTFVGYLDQGMLPNRFPDVGEVPEYNTADATLWLFEALRAYLAHTGDPALLHELFPALETIIAWHQRGTRYGIAVDPADGLLRCGAGDSQVTWMDVRVQGWVVTPRHGKPIEINALWHHALVCMAAFARQLGQPDAPYVQAAMQAATSFGRFWNPALGHCYDVLDTPHGDDATLRPNQVIAAALPSCPLPLEQRRTLLTTCGRRLLTSHGLRSLDPAHPDYCGRYQGDLLTRDGAYHQGTVWGWLIGPYALAHYQAFGDAAAARALLDPLLHHLHDTGLGTLSEVFDGDPPHQPRGCLAQAWTIGEVLRALWVLDTVSAWHSLASKSPLSP
ncbi:MAG: amylo-alpha-1,6-glucosidase [Oscillochloridaceae bacterium umkhey_bin13]